MKQLNVIIVTYFWVSTLLLLTTVSALADVEKFHGKALNSDGELIFIEEHTIRYENERIAAMNTIYYDAEYKQIGELVSDFSAGIQFGSYDFIDERSRYADGAKVLSNQILIYRKETPETETKEKYLKRESGQIVGQGFHPFILANLEELVRGDVISAKLVLPAQMDQFDVRIRKSNFKDGRLRIRIELDNWFLRLFAPYVEADYDTDTRRLLSYQGVSVVADASGKTVPVTISYEYSQQRLMLGSRLILEAAELELN